MHLGQHDSPTARCTVYCNPAAGGEGGAYVAILPPTVLEPRSLNNSPALRGPCRKPHRGVYQSGSCAGPTCTYMHSGTLQRSSCDKVGQISCFQVAPAIAISVAVTVVLGRFLKAQAGGTQNSYQALVTAIRSPGHAKNRCSAMCATARIPRKDARWPVAVRP